MGDTFPKNLAVWDVRARYSSGVSRSTFIQDIGRCFKWRTLTAESSTLPELLLGLHAWDCFVNDEFDIEDGQLQKKKGVKRAQSKKMPETNSGGGAAAAAGSPPRAVSSLSGEEMPTPTPRRYSTASSSSTDSDDDPLDAAWKKADSAIKKDLNPEDVTASIKTLVKSMKAMKGNRVEMLKEDRVPKIIQTQSGWDDLMHDDYSDEFLEYVYFTKVLKHYRAVDILRGIQVEYKEASGARRKDLEEVFEELQQQVVDVLDNAEHADHGIRLKFNGDYLNLKDESAGFPSETDDSGAGLEMRYDAEQSMKEDIEEEIRRLHTQGELKEADLKIKVAEQCKARRSSLFANSENDKYYSRQTILFTAKPQIGKTGTFIHLIRELYNYLPYVGTDDTKPAVSLNFAARGGKDPSKKKPTILKVGKHTTFKHLEQQVRNACDYSETGFPDMILTIKRGKNRPRQILSSESSGEDLKKSIVGEGIEIIAEFNTGPKGNLEKFFKLTDEINALKGGDEMKKFFADDAGAKMKEYIQLAKETDERYVIEGQSLPYEVIADEIMRGKKLTLDPKQTRLADLGCGTMEFSTYLVSKSEQIDKSQVYCVDFMSPPLDDPPP